jgi:hypothetical protein
VLSLLLKLSTSLLKEPYIPPTPPPALPEPSQIWEEILLEEPLVGDHWSAGLGKEGEDQDEDEEDNSWNSDSEDGSEMVSTVDTISTKISSTHDVSQVESREERNKMMPDPRNGMFFEGNGLRDPLVEKLEKAQYWKQRHLDRRVPLKSKLSTQSLRFSKSPHLFYF